MLKKVLAIILILSLLCGIACIFASCNNNKTFAKASKAKDGYATVYIPEDRDLRILLLSDPQVDLTEKYKAMGCLGNDATYNFVKDLVKVNNPDLVIINWDLVMTILLIRPRRTTKDMPKYSKNLTFLGPLHSVITM